MVCGGPVFHRILIIGTMPADERAIRHRQPDSMTYAEIVGRYHPAPDVDEIEGVYFNGIRTIQQKARYVVENKLSGVMVWEVGQDTTDDSSLLRANHEAVAK